MRSVVKALGLTIWGLIALGLIAIFIFVGYEAAIKYRVSHATILTDKAPSDQAAPGGIEMAPATSTGAGASAAFPRTADATRKLFSSAVQSRHYESAIKYGRELVDENSAEPSDLSSIAQSYFAISDCVNAAHWAEKAKEAFQKAGRVQDEGLGGLSACCESKSQIPRVALDSAQRARLDRLLNNSEAARAESGGLFVKYGELYYGYGEYELAIASIERGLIKGQVPRLDEAYVYLGLSEQAIGELDAARDAFAKLKDVPGISPRVLRLWTLYADKQLSSSKIRSAPGGAECQKAGAGGP